MHLFVFGDEVVRLRDFVLDLYGAANGLNDAGKFCDDAVSGPAEGSDPDARR